MACDVGGGRRTFSPEVVEAINRAYVRALGVLQIHKSEADRRVALAKYIMHLAQRGAVDEARLCDEAVALIKRTDRVRGQAHEI